MTAPNGNAEEVVVHDEEYRKTYGFNDNIDY